MRARLVHLLALVIFLTVVGATSAQADCVLLCSPSEPGPTPTPVPPPPSPSPSPPPPTVPPPAPQPEPKPGEVVSPAGAQRLLELINQTRAEHGLRPMAARGDVASIAVDHSMAMAKAGDIWHNDSYFTAATKKRLGARTVGENVALNESIDDAHRRLMNSPGHRANIVNPVFTVAGIGVVQKDGGSYYITEDFLEPVAISAPAPASERPRSMPAAPAPTASSATVPAPTTTAPTTEAREHFPNGIASTTSAPRQLQAGVPGDSASPVAVAAIALLMLTAAGAHRQLRRRRAQGDSAARTSSSTARSREASKSLVPEDASTT